MSVPHETLTGVILRAPIRPHLDVDAEPRTITGEGDTYDQAYTALVDQLPEGWDVLHVQRED